MKYEICYIRKDGEYFQQELETFSEFQAFKLRYQQLQQSPLFFHMQGISVVRTNSNELHEIVIIDRSKDVILMYRSTESGINTLVDLILGESHIEVLDSSLNYEYQVFGERKL